MRLCVLGKYPPIQGGVSSHTLWTLHGLALSGHEIHLVTNAEEVTDYRLDHELYADQPGLDPRVHAHVNVHSSLDADLIRGGPAPRYIPYANPFVTKLAGLAARVVTEAGCDLIYGFYLEPYGVAAQLASTWTGVPYGLRHAGSDVGRLYKHADLGESYDNIARNASFWISGSNSVMRGLRRAGVPADRFYPVLAHSLHTGYFRPDPEPMRFDEVGENISRLRTSREFHPYYGVRMRPGLPTIGIYGKIGRSKGTVDLLRAFAEVRKQGGNCNIVVVTGGTSGTIDRFQEAAAALGVSGEVSLLPFMPPWKIPGFIAACDAVAFLERDFPIDIHRPTVPREVLACGTCLVLSREVADYQEYADLLRHGENCLIADPRDTTALAASLRVVIDNPSAARTIGRSGYQQISSKIEDWPGSLNAMSQTFEDILGGIKERRFEMTVAETQAALARLSADETYRSWFELAPEAALNKYVLTEHERATIKGIDRELLRIFAASVKAKRRKKIVDAFPLCQKVCPDQTSRYFDRYYDLHPAEPGVPTEAQVASFGRFLADCLATDPSAPAYASALCRFELAAYELQLTVPPSDDLRSSSAGQPGPQAGDDPVEDSARPEVLPGVRVILLDQDIPAILQSIDDAPGAVSPPVQRDTNVVLRIRRNGSPEAFEVNASAAALLGLCTGEFSIADIERKLSGQTGQRNASGHAVRQALEQLKRLELIRITGAGPGGGKQ